MDNKQEKETESTLVTKQPKQILTRILFKTTPILLLVFRQIVRNLYTMLLNIYKILNNSTSIILNIPIITPNASQHQWNFYYRNASGNNLNWK